MARTIRTPGAPAPVAVPEVTELADEVVEAAAPVAEPDEPQGLPNAIDIDAKAIKGPVLTRQGWVCPDESGQAPKGPR